MQQALRFTQSSQPVVRLQNVSRVYGDNRALDQVSLEIPRGVVLGLVGANGAGKTTLIKHVLGLLRAERGQVRVFGLDPVRHCVEVMGRIGYLSEDRDLPPWMTVGALLRYASSFYRHWDSGYADQLRERFQLPSTSLVRTLSKGELAKAGLMVALAHRPELLVLDEPSSGLDPIVRREILEAVIRSVVGEGRTVLFSSHLLDEIARISDRVAMVASGRIVYHTVMKKLLEDHRRLVIRMPTTSPRLEMFPEALSLSGGPEEWTLVCDGEAAGLRQRTRRLGGEVVAEGVATFEEIFHARVSRSNPVLSS